MKKKGGDKLEKRLGRIMWKCTKVYKVYGYHIGDLFTDEYMQMCFFYKKSLKEVKKIPLGEVYSMDHPIARLEFKKVRIKDYKKRNKK